MQESPWLCNNMMYFENKGSQDTSKIKDLEEFRGWLVYKNVIVQKLNEFSNEMMIGMK